jgi:hypothetical protein
VPFFELWPALLFPMLDGLLVPLIRSALRFLQAVSQGFEQTTHMSRMIADSKLPSDHYGHSLARPRFSPKAVSLGSLCQKLGYSGALIFAQAGCRSGWRVVSQAFHSLLSGALHPLADGPFSYPESFGYLLLFAALLL